jgi:hypothetical protein
MQVPPTRSEIAEGVPPLAVERDDLAVQNAASGLPTRRSEEDVLRGFGASRYAEEYVG